MLFSHAQNIPEYREYDKFAKINTNKNSVCSQKAQQIPVEHWKNAKLKCSEISHSKITKIRRSENNMFHSISYCFCLALFLSYSRLCSIPTEEPVRIAATGFSQTDGFPGAQPTASKD